MFIFKKGSYKKHIHPQYLVTLSHSFNICNMTHTFLNMLLQQKLVLSFHNNVQGMAIKFLNDLNCRYLQLTSEVTFTVPFHIYTFI